MTLPNTINNRIEARAELAAAHLLFNPPSHKMVTSHNLAAHIIARCLAHPKQSLQVSEDQLRLAFGQAWDARQIYGWAKEQGLSVIENDAAHHCTTFKFQALTQ